MEFLAGEVAEFQRGFEQAGLIDMGRVGDLGGFVVSNLRRQRRH